MGDFYPSYNLADRIQHTKLDSGLYGIPSARMERMETPATGDFKAVFSGLVENFNQELNAPDNLLKDVMSGNNNIDIHDVMTAMAKSEITVNITTTAVGKVIQAYDNVMQIQV
ncbi:flagellar hook-basal body complex protein FliE [Spirochaetes bacterium]|uniref:Flagellar hook-basal body complex protein FliE n=1 Tax=Candidatus Scatousia excrementipullorum TaxID=2840936 RepID=A0A9D9DRL9_9BACT|nr:flagellar hook-basal body complex protein FliE [Candidatus Scatousia excrementipullorum]